MLQRKLFLISCLVAGVLAPAVTADELPRVVLNLGDNVVFLSVVNKGEEPLHQLGVTVQPEALPDWVKVGEVAPRLGIPANSRSTERLLLDIRVEEEGEGQTFDVPLKLKDGEHRTWTATVLAEVQSGVPAEYALLQNTPNPFNPNTEICYDLLGDRSYRTRLEIFNDLGQKVRTLVNGAQAAGSYSVTWDGRNDQGQQLSSGMYLYRVVSGDFAQTRRMLLVK